MRPILNCSSDSLEVNALFIQPTYDCGGNCKGCYVKARNKQGQINPKEIINLVWRFVMGQNGCRANQITCSIDQWNVDQSDALHYFLMELAGVLMTSAVKREVRPEVHLTMRSPQTLKEYTWYDYIELYKSIDMVSYSTLSNTKEENTDIKDICRLTKVNYNHLIPANITSQNIAEYVKNIAKIGENVHSIYLIVNKDLQRKELSQEEFAIARAKLIHDITVINTLRERLPKSVWKKCNIDGCLQDIRRSRRTSYGCSSNVSRFQVWPDGSVSGCPYAASGIGEGRTRTVQDILANIKEARATYDFGERCTLRKIYDSIVR